MGGIRVSIGVLRIPLYETFAEDATVRHPIVTMLFLGVKSI